jgi:PAS domain S-box-containing protein
MTHAPNPAVAMAEVLGEGRPLLVSDLDTMVVVSANDAAYELLGGTPDTFEGSSVTDIVQTDDRPAAEASLRLLGSGAIDGYRAVRHLRKADGTEFAATVWVRVRHLDGKRLVVVAIEGDSAGVPWPLRDAGARIALVVTDHDWVIEHVSNDVEGILGFDPESYKGSPLLALLRPSDVRSFMVVVGHVAAGGGAATLPMHLRTAQGHWQDLYGLVLAMCRHTPPRLGLAFAVIDDREGATTSDRQRQVAERCVDALDGMDPFRSHLSLGDFSTRQWEILSRLVRGERVGDIAKALYLSPSTVRNHLTAIYRKFGVHSQAELVAKVLTTPD